MASISVFMYHAVADVPAGADPHYAVNRTQFLAHLAMVREAGRRPASVLALRTSPQDTRQRDPAFTFDDGHASNAWAAEALAAAGGSGDFFVNPSTVGNAHCLSWSALRDMADAGMSIQSHGQNHRYLDELGEAEVHAELADSKRAIEDAIGRPVTLFAPPGGRMGRGFLAAARRAGYEAVCSSRVGTWAPHPQGVEVPRFAVLQTTPSEQWRRWLVQDRVEMLRIGVRHHVLAAGKRALGNRRYERLRQSLLGQPS